VRKEELELAQFLLNTYQGAEKYADRVDPERRREDSVSRSLEAISASASTAYVRLTGRLPSMSTQHNVDLNTLTPAPWARDHVYEGDPVVPRGRKGKG
jgi:hypothetical protein